MNGAYNTFAFAVLWSWIPLVVLMFAVLPPRRAVIAAIVIGYLFLPDLNRHYPTLPDLNKVSITEVGVILGSLIFDGGRLFTIRPRRIDIPCLLLCFVPVASSLSNGFGLMDGLATSATIITKWGLAYWIGRAYFTDWEAVRELSLGIILGGLAYMPLCWWEIRMSPMLHYQIYGWLFITFRSGFYGWRPNLFLENGLSVTMFMGVTSVLAYWAWMTRSPKKFLGMPMWLIALSLAITTVFCKAMGGIVLMFAGMGALAMVRFWPKTKVAVLLLILAAPTYIVVRTSGEWSGNKLVELASRVSEERAGSLAFRLRNENLLIGKALEQPWLGWGGWGRAHVFDMAGRDRTIVDGLWIIIFGDHGLIGLGSLLAMVLGSALLLWWRTPTRYWTDAACAAPVALAVVLSIYMIDSLFNATFNPIASVAAGAVASISLAAKRAFVAPPAAPAARMPAPLVYGIKDIPYVQVR